MNKNVNLMPFISRAFIPGQAKETIEAIEDPDERKMARAEFAHFTGNPGEALALTKDLLSHEEPALRLSAYIIHCIAGLAAGDASAVLTLEKLDGLYPDGEPPLQGGYCADVVRVLLHQQETEPWRMDAVSRSLSEGARFFMCYVLALREYLRGEYGSAVGITNTALALGAGDYPVAAIYLHIISTITLVRLKRMEEAEQHFLEAQDLMIPDAMVSPFAEHYVLLSGFNKKLIKPKLAEEYQAISELGERYMALFVQTYNSLGGAFPGHGPDEVRADRGDPVQPGVEHERNRLPPEHFRQYRQAAPFRRISENEYQPPGTAAGTPAEVTRPDSRSDPVFFGVTFFCPLLGDFNS